MTDLEKIKKEYGEQMAHFCRSSFPGILEKEGNLYDIISSHFAPSKFLFEDIKKHNLERKFKDYVHSFVTFEIPDFVVDKPPKELLDEAGYDFYECHSEADIQSFRKYYLPSERLCTFKGGRLEECYVFFAVKKDVDQIKREDFIHPMRQDRYGTSVISIQFFRGEVNTLSIKNRYNHTVEDPDSTFSNDLENIIAGLTKSFELEYNLNIQSNVGDFEIPGYVLAGDGKFYKYNVEINNIYYCPNNIIIDHGKVINAYQEKERYVLFDYFILDKHEKIIFTYDKRIKDSFSNRFGEILKNELVLNKETGEREITLTCTNGNAKIKLNKAYEMISYEDDIELDIDDYYLYHERAMEDISLKNVKRINNNFMHWNTTLKRINIPKCEIIMNNFLASNNSLEVVSIPNVEYIADYFLCYNRVLKELDLPNCIKIGKMFMQNSCIEYLHLPKVKQIASCFMMFNKCILGFSAPELEDAGRFFLNSCTNLKKIYVPSLKSAEYGFLEHNKDAIEIYTPSLIKIENGAFKSNTAATELYLPSTIKIGNDFFNSNRSLKKVYIPNCLELGEGFMPLNMALEELIIHPDALINNQNLLKYIKTQESQIKK